MLWPFNKINFGDNITPLTSADAQPLGLIERVKAESDLHISEINAKYYERKNLETIARDVKRREKERKNQKLQIIQDNCSHILINGKEHHFGIEQAKIIKLLYNASKTNNPWVHCKALTGSPDKKIQNLFNKHKNWRDVIDSDKRGYYKLKID